MSENIQATFNGKPTLSFVQGESLAVAVALRDTNTGNPLDLTGAAVRFEFLGLSGYAVRRFSDGLVMLPSDVQPGMAFVVAAHGLVTGDAVTFSGVSLPAPLAAGTVYLVQVIDANTFVLTDSLGNPIAITQPASATYILNQADITISAPASSGIVTLLLRSTTTQAIQDGMSQTFQIEIRSQAQTLTIGLMRHELDVFAQVVQ